MSFMEALRPPRKEGGGAHHLRLGLQRHTVLGLGLLQLLDRGEMAIDQRRIGEGPQMLRRWEFWRVGWEEVEIEVVRHAQAETGMPTGPIQDEDDLLLGASSSLAREGGEFGFKERNAHRGGQMKAGAAR